MRTKVELSQKSVKKLQFLKQVVTFPYLSTFLPRNLNMWKIETQIQREFSQIYKKGFIRYLLALGPIHLVRT